MILNANKIEFRFAEEPILSGLDLKIVAGDHIALVGPNGCGKSTLIKILTRQLEPDSGTINSAQGAQLLTLDQVDAPSADESVRDYLENGLAHWRALKHDFESSLEKLNATPEDEDALAEFGQCETVFRLHDGYAYPARVDAALNALSLMPHADQPAARLSGGQQHRCRLARLLLTPADLWILDEPTNHLDDAGINWLVQLLSNCRHAWLVISHDRHVLEQCPAIIGELDHGRIERYQAPYSNYLIERQQRRETMSKAWTAYEEEAKRLSDFVAKYKAGQKSKQASARAKALERLTPPASPPSQKRSLPIAFEHVPRSADEVLKIKGLVSGYDRALVASFDSIIRRGDRIVIKGLNGCGKTTLLRTLIGDLEPLDGDLQFGVKVHHAMLSQHIDLILGEQSAGEWLESQVQVVRIQQARNLAGGLGLGRQALLRPCDQLSGGERMRLALTSLLLRDLNFIILDEPTNHLDLAAREGLETALSRYPGTLFVVSHDRQFCEAIGTRWWSIQGGQLLETRRPTPESTSPRRSDAKPKGLQLKERQKERRRMVAKADKAEQKVDQLIREIEALDSQLNDPATQDDWQHLQELEHQRSHLSEQQTQVEIDWLELCDRIEAFDEDLPKT